MRRLIAAIGFAKAGALKADPFFYALVVSAVSAAATPTEVLPAYGLFLWLIIGSMCGFCYALFKDDKKALNWRIVLSKLVTCFIPGFCFTGAGIKIAQSMRFQFEASPSIVLGLAMLLSVLGVKVVDAASKKVEGRINGGDL